MILTTVEQWRNWSSTYTMLPYVIKLGLADDRIASWQEAWKVAAPDSFVLESGKGGRYTFFGLQPFSTVHGTGLDAEMTMINKKSQRASWKYRVYKEIRSTS